MVTELFQPLVQSQGVIDPAAEEERKRKEEEERQRKIAEAQAKLAVAKTQEEQQVILGGYADIADALQLPELPSVAKPAKAVTSPTPGVIPPVVAPPPVTTPPKPAEPQPALQSAFNEERVVQDEVFKQWQKDNPDKVYYGGVRWPTKEYPIQSNWSFDNKEPFTLKLYDGRIIKADNADEYRTVLQTIIENGGVEFDYSTGGYQGKERPGTYEYIKTMEAQGKTDYARKALFDNVNVNIDYQDYLAYTEGRMTIDEIANRSFNPLGTPLGEAKPPSEMTPQQFLEREREIRSFDTPARKELQTALSLQEKTYEHMLYVQDIARVKGETPPAIPENWQELAEMPYEFVIKPEDVPADFKQRVSQSQWAFGMNSNPKVMQEMVDKAQKALDKERKDYLPENWTGNVVLDVTNPQGYGINITTPSGWTRESNNNYKDAQGNTYTAQQMVENPTLVDSYASSFSDSDIADLKKWATTDYGKFVNLLTRIGDTPETRGILKQLYPDLTDNEVNAFYQAVQSYGQVNPVTGEVVAMKPITAEEVVSRINVNEVPASFKLQEFADVFINWAKGLAPNAKEKILFDGWMANPKMPDKLKVIGGYLAMKTWEQYGPENALNLLTNLIDPAFTVGVSSFLRTQPFEIWNPELEIAGQEFTISGKEVLPWFNPAYWLPIGGFAKGAKPAEELVAKAASEVVKFKGRQAVVKAVEKEAAELGVKAEAVVNDAEKLVVKDIENKISPSEIKLPPEQVEVKAGEPYKAGEVTQTPDGKLVKTETPTYRELKVGEPIPDVDKRYIDPVTKKMYVKVEEKPIVIGDTVKAVGAKDTYEGVVTFIKGDSIGIKTAAGETMSWNKSAVSKAAETVAPKAEQVAAKVEQAVIPKELEPLVEEARKYKTFKEFEDALVSEKWRQEHKFKEGIVGDVASMGFPKATEIATEGKYIISGRQGIKDFWETAQGKTAVEKTATEAIPKTEVAPKVGGKPTERYDAFYSTEIDRYETEIRTLKNELSRREKGETSPTTFFKNTTTERIKELVNVGERGLERVKSTIKADGFKVIKNEYGETRIVEALPEVAPKVGETQPFIVGRQPSATGAGTQTEMVKQSEIIKELSDKLNVPIRRGHFNKSVGGAKAGGIYKKGKEIIRINEGQVNTVSHEIGHLLDDRYGLAQAIPEAKLDSFVAKYGGTPKDKRAEAFGEFIRYYITDPKKAKSLDNTFFTHFEDNIPESVKTVLLDARGDFARWKDMPATAKVLSQVELTPVKQGRDWEETFHNLYTDSVDKYHPISQFVAAAKKDGIEVTAEKNPYMLTRLLAGENEKVAVFMEHGTFTGNFWKVEKGKVVPNFTGKPLQEILKPISNDITDFIGYMTAKRAAELEAKGIKTGITLTDAKQAIMELDSKYPEFANSFKELREYQGRIIDYVASKNSLSKDGIEKLKTFYEDYVPFYRVMEDLYSGGAKGKKLVDVSTGIKSIKGSERQIVNPLESIIKNSYTLIDAADRNAVGLAMADIANQGKYTAQLFEKVPPDMMRAHDIVDVGKYLKELGVDVESLGMSKEQMQMAVDIFRPSFLQSDNIVAVLRKGKREYYQVDPELYKALKSMNTEQMIPLVKMMSYPARWLRAGATLSPDFWAGRNWIRDTMDAAVISRNGFLPLYDTVKGLFSIFKDPELYDLWRMSGSAHSMIVSLDRSLLQQSLKDLLASPGSKALNILKHPLDALQKLSEFTEAASKLGEFGRALKKIGSPLEAGFSSREVTVDFARIGAQIQKAHVNSLVAFWNANVQGTDRVIRAFKDAPVSTSLKAIAGLTLPSIGLWYANHNDPRYKELPAWQKDLFWIILTPDNVYRIPKPFILGQVFATMPERVLDWIYDRDPKQMEMALEQFVRAQSPGWMPTAVMPFVEIATNKDLFRDTPLVSESLQGLLKSEQYKSYTSDTMKLLSQKVPLLSPIEYEHLFRDYLAGLGGYALKASDIILQSVGLAQTKVLPSATLADYPVVKAFVVRNPYGTGSQSVQDVYDILEKYEAKEQKAKSFITNKDSTGFAKYKSENLDLKLTIDSSTHEYYSQPARYLRQVAADLSTLRKAEDMIYRNNDISSATKRQKIDEIDILITEVARAYLDNLQRLPGDVALPSGSSAENILKRYK